MHKLLLNLKLIDNKSIRKYPKNRTKFLSNIRSNPNRIRYQSTSFFSYPLNSEPRSNPIRKLPILSWKPCWSYPLSKRPDPILSEKSDPVRRIYFDLILWVNRLTRSDIRKKLKSPKKSIQILLKPDQAWEANLILKSNSGKTSRDPRSMGKPVTVPIPLIQDQLFISALLLNFPNNLAGGTHAKAESVMPKA